MAPRIRVPADFGREHINSEAHGNLTLKLRDGGQMKTNSMIMSLNSPVIDRLTTSLCQTTLEMDDFQNEAVDCFVESMYTGEIHKLTQNIFEDVNKMAHAFKVSWLSKRCFKFYQTVVLNFEKNTYEEIVFACEIASRAHSNLKQSKYVSCFINSASSWKIGKSIFLQRYMADFANLSKRQLDMSLAIGRKDLIPVVQCLISYLSFNFGAQNFDENSLYILEKLDLQKLNRDNPSYFAEFMCFLSEISEISKNDRINSILKKTRYIEGSLVSEASSNTKFRSRDSLRESDDSDLEEIDHEMEDYFENSAVQTDDTTLAQSDWKLLSDSEAVVFLPLQERVLEMVTTKDDVDKQILFQFKVSGEKKIALHMYFYCHNATSSKWSYVLSKCTKFTFGIHFLRNVPYAKVKYWKITKTDTYMKIVCNDVTVLYFNFEINCDKDYKKEAKLWASRPNSVVISSTSSALTFLRAK